MTGTEALFLIPAVLLKQESANTGPWAMPVPQTTFVNAVLLEHSHAHLFLDACDYVLTTVAELSSYDRDCLALKAKSIYCLVLYRKSLPISLLEHGNFCPSVLTP